MSPARKSKKATSKKAKARAAPRKAAKAAKKAKPTKAKAARPSAKSAPKAKAHCAAMDPFGTPCQSIPRYGSKYCTIHSYLDR